MKRTHWSLFLLCGMLVGLMPALAHAGAFEATELSTLTMTSGSAGGALMELQNTGVVIEDVADSSYIHYSGSTATTYTGYPAIVQAIADGSVAASAGSLNSSSQGIVPENAVNGNPNAQYFAIGEANNNDLQQATWGGFALSTTGNEAVLRETYAGDGNMDGFVNILDYDLWANEFRGITSAPVAWNRGDYNYDGFVNILDYDIWANSFKANLPSLGSSAGPVQLSGGPVTVPEPGTLALFVAGALGCVVAGRRKLRKANKNSTTYLCQASKGCEFMKKCLPALAAIAAMVVGNSARADLLDYSLVADQVYTSQAAYVDYQNTGNSADLLSGASITNSGQTVSLPSGTTSAYVVMAILATVNTPTSQPISTDGVAQTIMNFVASTNNMGSGSLVNSVTAASNDSGPAAGGAYPNDGSLVGSKADPNANPGLNSGGNGNDLTYWSQTWGSPLQAFSLSNQSKPIEWGPVFNATGSQSGVQTVDTSSSIVIGKNGAYNSSDVANAFVTLFAPPASVPSTDRVVSYSNADTVSGYGAKSSAIQPSSFLIGASGISSTSASFVLGELDYTFSGASNGATASLLATPADISSFTQAGKGESADFIAGGVEYQPLGPTSGTLGSGAPLTITIAGGASPVASNVTLSALGAPSVISGGTGAISGTLSNSGNVSQQETVTSYSVSGTAGAGSVTTLTNNSASIAPNGSTSISVTYNAPSAGSGFFGPTTVTLAASGSGATLASTGSTLGTTVNVVGVGNNPSADGSGVRGTYGQSFSTTVGSGGSYAGLETTLGGISTSGIGSTFATILAGSNGTGGSTNVTMAWRSRSSSELPANSDAAIGALPLFSDVANLQGTATSGGTASAYTLEMSYGSTQVGSASYIAHAASNGLLYLGYYNGSKWVNAIAGNTGGTQDNGTEGPNAVTDYTNSWASFMAGPGAGLSLGQLLGSWGVDTTNNTTWAVVDHNSEFAVVPEPGTLALLAAGLAALGLAYRRRKLAKA